MDEAPKDGVANLGVLGQFADRALPAFERGESLPCEPSTSHWRFLEAGLRALQEERWFEAGGGPFLRATPLGREMWRRLSVLLEGVRRLDVLARVNLQVELDESVSDDGVDVLQGVVDPRFRPPSSAEEAEAWGSEDLRLAVLTYLSSQRPEAEEADAYQVGLLLHLAEGRLAEDAAWFDLAHGAPFHQLEERVASAYRYSDVSDDPAEIDDVMRHIFESSVVERRKRTGEPATCVWP